MQDDENPYTSPKAKQQRDSALNSPTNGLAKKSPFNLDGAALGLLIHSSFELLYLAPIAIALLLVATNKQIAATLSIHSSVSFTAALIGCLKSIVGMASAYCMHKRKFYSFAVTGAILTCMGIVLMPLWFSVPFGIWALVILLRKDTRAAFAGVS
jgi:hypothetical protein